MENIRRDYMLVTSGSKRQRLNKSIQNVSQLSLVFLINISNFKILVFTQKAWCSKLIKKEKKTLRQLLCQLMVSLAKILSGNEYFVEKQGLKDKCKILRRVYQPKTLPAYIPESKKGFYLALPLIFILHVDSKFC